MRSSDDNIPDSVHYQANSDAVISTAWGVAVSGVAIYNGISAEGTDPFYPAKYGAVRFPDDVVEKVD